MMKNINQRDAAMQENVLIRRPSLITSYNAYRHPVHIKHVFYHTSSV